MLRIGSLNKKMAKQPGFMKFVRPLDYMKISKLFFFKD